MLLSVIAWIRFHVVGQWAAHSRYILYNCALSFWFLMYRNFISWFVLCLIALFSVPWALVLIPLILIFYSLVLVA